MPDPSTAVRTAAIDVLILVYRPDSEELQCCVDSALASPLARVVVAVNNEDPNVRRQVSSALDGQERVTVVENGANWGYAGGINRGLSHCTSDNVLLLNDDAFLEPGALQTLADRLDSSDDDVVGVSPKILLARVANIIDACGALTTGRAATFNRGAGEPDIGQYDTLHETGGACFAAVLLRRSAFDPDVVGPLAERFFMYVEDADWCLRARLLGLRFLCEPAAVVRHVHSGSTSDAPNTWKTDLIDRNSWLMAVRCLPTGRAALVSAHRLSVHGRRLVSGPGRHRSLRLLKEVGASLPWAVRSRRSYRGGLFRSHRRDDHLLALATDAGDCLTVVEGRPVTRRNRSTAREVALRCWQTTRDPNDGRRAAEIAHGSGWEPFLDDPDGTAPRAEAQ